MDRAGFCSADSSRIHRRRQTATRASRIFNGFPARTRDIAMIVPVGPLAQNDVIGAIQTANEPLSGQT